jgi:hypothetical protein
MYLVLSAFSSSPVYLLATNMYGFYLKIGHPFVMCTIGQNHQSHKFFTQRFDICHARATFLGLNKSNLQAQVKIHIDQVLQPSDL